ncbi:MAG: GntR family transcriptional regulator [Chloroflexi bacterium]|nr:GntR family transcriptional regulator [Chloroflexota bacterium]
MDIEINFQTHIPIYTQVMHQIKRIIASGELNPGDQLPTVRHLAAELDVNFNTIARAYRLLDETGIISTQHGRGTYILEQPDTATTDKLRRETLYSLADQFLAEAKKLGHSPAQIKGALEKKIGVDETNEVLDSLVKPPPKPSSKRQ